MRVARFPRILGAVRPSTQHRLSSMLSSISNCNVSLNYGSPNLYPDLCPNLCPDFYPDLCSEFSSDLCSNLCSDLYPN